jgi:hypothetical protein
MRRIQTAFPCAAWEREKREKRAKFQKISLCRNEGIAGKLLMMAPRVFHDSKWPGEDT